MLLRLESQGAMPAMGMGSLQDALNKKIQERNNKDGATKTPTPPQQSKWIHFCLNIIC